MERKHLRARYKELFDDYFGEKLKIFARQTGADCLVLNGDAANLRQLEPMARSRTFYYSRLSRANGAYLDGRDIVVAADGEPVAACSVGDMRIKGVHNVENVLASALAATLAGVEPAAIRRAVRGFAGLHHRVEPVGAVDGVEYIDDSKGTTVDSTKRALESFETPVVLIAGGKDKMSDYAAIRETVRRRVSHLILIGEARARIREALGDIVETREAPDLAAAVRLAHTIARAGQAVILSPMCSSFDMFRDYKHRGDVFKAAVLALKGAPA